jgi:hypothetical protein
MRTLPFKEGASMAARLKALLSQKFRRFARRRKPTAQEAMEP